MSQLEDLLQQCTVKITIPGGWGTGFFVATGLILTCAHVVRKATDSQVTVSYPAWQQPLSATVKAQADDDRTLDLALIELAEPLPDHPCVLLDEESVAIGQALYSYGYLESYTNAAPVRPVNEGLTGDTPPLLKLQGAQIEKGISGAALLNLKTGKVCGMVKETRAAGFDLGGGAIPTRVILEQFPELRSLQQVFHGSDRCWVNLITTQSGIDFQPYLQAILTNEDYQEWQEVYTPTTVEDRRRMSTQDTTIASQRRFSSRLKLRAETVKPDKLEQGNQPDGAQEPQERVEQWDVLAGLRNYAAEHVVLIGKPGSGKSTSLERLLWEEAEKALQDPKIRIPVLVKLRRCTGTIEGLIRDFLLGHQVALEIAQIEALLHQGKFLLLLDGLNELPKAFETEAVNFRDRYRRTTPMIISTRDLGRGGTLGIEKTLRMLPLTEPQMREFVRGYLGEEGDRLFQQLQGDRLRKFAETPLLLWMLCRVFAQSGQVPANLGLAFREFAHLHDQELQADVQADSKDQWHKLLRHLAFVMMQGKTLIDPQLSIPREEAEDCLTAYLRQEDRANPRECAEQWLKDLLKYHLIQPVIQPNFGEHIEFRHQLIQEYYAAECILKLLPTLTDDQLKQDFLNYLKWTEPLVLMLALVDSKEEAEQVVQLALNVDWMLGARLAGEVKPEFQVQTVKFVEDLEVPDWLKVQLLGETRSDTAIPRLLKQMDNFDEQVRVRAANNVDETGSAETVSALLELLERSDIEMYEEASDRLEEEMYWRERDDWRYQFNSENDIPYLLNLLENSHLRRITKALHEIGSVEAIPTLLKLLETDDLDVSGGAAIALSKIGSIEAIPGLLKLLEHSNYDVRKSAAEALGKIDPDEAIPSSLELLEDDTSNMNRNAARALGRSTSGDTISTLLKQVEHSSSDVRDSVAKALGKSGSDEAIPALLKLVEDHDFFVSLSAREALAELDSDEAISPLLELVEVNDSDIRGNVAYRLGEIGSAKMIPVLLKLVEDSSSDVRGSAAEALGKIGSVEAVQTLIKLCYDFEPWVRRAAAEALGKIGSEHEIPHLLRLIEDSSYYAREGATEGLSNIAEKHPDALSVCLPHLLDLIPTRAGKQALEGITAIQTNCKFYNHEIFQAHLEAQEGDRQKSQNSDRPATTNPVIYDLRGAAIANLAHEVHGNQITQPEELS